MLGSGCKAASSYVSGVASFVYRISLLPSLFRFTWAASGFAPTGPRSWLRWALAFCVLEVFFYALEGITSEGRG
jgi:hypothetical protein